ncbi:MAG: SGNH/GDSL hydrolase family protein [Desulfobacteraceae bacterium]|nr:SGNH/GDSL hydrolase family protein [Desulfobacteraceae bacterium]
MKKRLLSIVFVFLLCVGLPLSSSAAPFNNFVVFGDSLSDTGNVDRYTDGPLWNEMLAGHLGVTNFYNFAFAGATSGVENLGDPTQYGLQWELTEFIPLVAPLLPAPDTLVSVWAGANDLSFGRSPFEAATNVGNALDNLYSAGARNFLVANLPDIGSTPKVIDAGDSAIATWFTVEFNTTFESILSTFESTNTDANIYFIDAFTMFNGYPIGSPEWQELFWIDDFHPSSIGHEIIFETAAAAVGAPVPIPSSLPLLGFALLALVGIKRKIRI